MAIGVSKKFGSSSALVQSSYTTASWTPVANNGYLLAITSRLASGTPVSPTISGNGLSWVKITEIRLGTTTRMLTLYRALKPSGVSAGAITIDYGGVNQAACCWSLIEFTGMDTSGTDGSGFIVQSNTGGGTDTAGTSGACSLSAWADSTNNVGYYCLANNNGLSATPESGWTELTDTQPDANTGLEDGYRTGQDLNIVPTFSSCKWAMIAVEIRVPLPAPTYNDTPSGGIILGGSSALSKSYADTPSGGVVLGGSLPQSTLSRDVTPSGGVVLGGSVTISTSLAPSGGLVLGGSATSARIADRTPSGGLVLGGSNTASLIWPSSTPSAGIKLNGSCSSSTGASGNYNDFPSGGIRLGGSVSTALLIAVTPDTDINDGSWTDQNGTTNLFPAIDEAAANDADYIKSAFQPLIVDICEVEFPGVVDPQASTGHVLTYRYGSEATGYTTVSQTLTGAQADAITNYAHITVKFEAVV